MNECGARERNGSVQSREGKDEQDQNSKMEIRQTIDKEWMEKARYNQRHANVDGNRKERESKLPRKRQRKCQQAVVIIRP